MEKNIRKPKETLQEYQIKTARPSRDNATPRLPHERDESDDSQESEVRDDMRQAYTDLQNGQVDTDLHNTRGISDVVNETPGITPDQVLNRPPSAPPRR